MKTIALFIVRLLILGYESFSSSYFQLLKKNEAFLLENLGTSYFFDSEMDEGL